MAIATTTAAAISAGVGLIGAGTSIAGGAAAKKRAKDAARASAVALEEARKTIEVNEQEGVQVPLDSYEMAMRETTAQQEQALAALTEADSRSLAAGVGKLSAAGGNAIERQRQAMGQDIYKRDQAVAAEEANINNQLSGISLQEATGAQAAAQDAEQQATYAMSEGVAAGLGAGVDAYKASALFGKTDTSNMDLGTDKMLDGMEDGSKTFDSEMNKATTFQSSGLSQSKGFKNGQYTGAPVNKFLGGKDYSKEFGPLGGLYDPSFFSLNPSIKK